LLLCLLVARPEQSWCDEDVWLEDVRGQLSPELDCSHLARAESALAGLLEFDFSVNAKVFFRYLYALRDLGCRRLLAQGRTTLASRLTRPRRKSY
jgi:hypothetical protein